MRAVPPLRDSRSRTASLSSRAGGAPHQPRPPGRGRARAAVPGADGPGTARTEPAAIALTTPAVPGSSALSPGAAVSVLGAYAVLLLVVAAQLVLHRDAA